MAAQQGTVRFHHEGPTLLLQVEGWATMKQSLPLRRFMDQNLSGQTKTVWVDLSQCTYLDSTFLGTLLFVQRTCTRLGDREFSLLSPSVPCLSLLQQMGVIDVFQIRAMEASAPPCWTELTKETEDKPGLQRTVIQAHEELARLPGAAGEPFRAVVRCLEKEMEKRQ